MTTTLENTDVKLALDLKDLATDFIYTIVEGEGVKQKELLAGSTPK